MKIIKETDRPIGKIEEWSGVCDGCGVSLEYIGELVVIEVVKTETIIYLCPKDRLVCPNCNHEIHIIRLYINMDISKELEAIKHETRN